MFLYTVIEAVLAVVTGILIALCTKRANGVTYSKLSFAVQFAGVVGIGMTLLLFFLFYGNLLRPLN